MPQNINIERVESGGVVNIYGTEDKKQKNKESITMAAVDKYSTPLRAEIELSPWGKKMYRVSFLLYNDLISQVLQQNYLTYKSEEKAKEVFTELIDLMN